MNGALIDGGWYLAVIQFARETPWLHTPVLLYTDFVGLVLFAAMMVIGWWTTRSADSRLLTAALWPPVAVVLAYLVNDLVKLIVQEPRPCQQIAHVVMVTACEAPGDFSFPSNHSAIAGAFAASMLMISRKLGVIAVVAGLLMVASRVYIGAHYPHDVIVGALIGVVVAVASGLAAQRLLPARVDRMRTAVARRETSTSPKDPSNRTNPGR